MNLLFPHPDRVSVSRRLELSVFTASSLFIKFCATLSVYISRVAADDGDRAYSIDAAFHSGLSGPRGRPVYPESLVPVRPKLELGLGIETFKTKVTDNKIYVFQVFELSKSNCYSRQQAALYQLANLSKSCHFH